MVNPPSMVDPRLPLQSILIPTRTQLLPKPLPTLSPMHSPLEVALAPAALLAAVTVASEACLAATAAHLPSCPHSTLNPPFSLSTLNSCCSPIKESAENIQRVAHFWSQHS